MKIILFLENVRFSSFETDVSVPRVGEQIVHGFGATYRVYHVTNVTWQVGFDEEPVSVHVGVR